MDESAVFKPEAPADAEAASATVFNIQTLCLHDGPGLRTTVFFKGCPLRCRWCSNPESISPNLELGVIRARCNKCGKCLAACPQEALSLDTEGLITVDRAKCDACGKCVPVCYQEALTVYGKGMTLAEVVDKVRRDKMFFDGSGGGVTVSGGEPLIHAPFVVALFEACHVLGIQTCIQTTGHIRQAELEKVLSVTDYVLYDLKHMDSDLHREFTGQPNELILTNAKLTASKAKELLFRIPLIPGFNDTLSNITATALFVRSLGRDLAVQLLPYHRLGMGKYDNVDRPYLIKDLKSPSPEEVEAVRQRYEELGVSCSVS
ncbi:MAG: glycyl-radical enzyme activating protein [Chloroflexi bacterium]|nr:glycyl-radical enzyme activating protein [Chloroflexota bacterium]